MSVTSISESDSRCMHFHVRVRGLYTRNVNISLLEKNDRIADKTTRDVDNNASTVGSTRQHLTRSPEKAG